MLQTLLFEPSVLALCALTAFAPWRWLWRCWALIGLALAILFELYPAERNPGFAHFAGIAILVAIGAICLLVLALRVAVWLAYRYLTGARHSPTPRRDRLALVGMDVALTTAGGAYAAALLLKHALFALAGMEHGYLASASLVAAPIAGAVSAYKKQLWRSSAGWRGAGTLAVFLLTTAATGLYSLYYPHVVSASALRIAAEQPYCIALGKRRRPVTSLEDLTLVTMDKGGWRHHAILLVERAGGIRSYHWSHRKGRFMPGTYTSAAACIPRSGFLDALPFRSGKLPETAEIYANEIYHRIPWTYHPSFYNRSISISVEPPEFKPASSSSRKYRASMSPSSGPLPGPPIEELLAHQPTGRHGRLVEIKDGPNGWDWFYRLDADGDVVSSINCPDADRCQHRFRHRRRAYNFEHPPRLIDQSEAMEQRLVDLFRSFEGRRVPMHATMER